MFLKNVIYIFLLGILIAFFTACTSKTSRFTNDMEKAMHLLKNQPDSSLVLYKYYKNRAVTPYQKQFLNLLKIKLSTSPSTNNVDSLRSIMTATYTDTPKSTLRKYALIAFLEELYQQNPSYLVKTQTKDSLLKTLNTYNWFSPYLEGEFIGKYISLQFKNRSNTEEEIQQNLKRLAQLAKQTKEVDLQFKYLDKKWYLNYISTNVSAQKRHQQLLDDAFEILELASKYNNNEYYLKAYSRLSTSYYNLKLYPQSIQWIFKSLPILEQENNNEELGNFYNNMGVLYQENQDLNSSITSLKKAKYYYNKTEEKNEKILATNYNIGIIYTELQQRDSTIYYFNLVDKGLEKVAEKGVQNNYYFLNNMSLAEIASLEGNYPFAEDKFKDLATKLDYSFHTNYITDYYLKYGNHKLRTKQYNQAIELCSKALETVYENDLTKKMECLTCLKNANTALQNTAQALLYSENLYALNSQYLSQNNAEKLTTEKLQFNFNKKLEQKETEHQLKIKEKEKLIYFSLLLVIICLFIVYNLYKTSFFRKKILETTKKKNKIISEKNEFLNAKNREMEQVLVSLENSKKEIEQLLKLNENSLYNKQVEMNANKVKIDKLAHEIEELISEKEVKKSDLLKIENVLQSMYNEKDLWIDFQNNYERIRPGFFDKLRAIYPDITTNDLKHAAYVASNLKSKEVADLINVSPRSVETVRYRLKKKLNIAKNESLSHFLQTI